jgi:hypothetical protein
LFQDYTNLLPVPLHILEELCERTVLVGIESQPQVAPQLIEHVCDILRQLLLQGIRALVTQIVNSWAKVTSGHKVSPPCQATLTRRDQWWSESSQKHGLSKNPFLPDEAAWEDPIKR